uniref:Histone deacetylase 10 n=1 Tax=Naja naja TaxID=35670 RepID=A0A8C6VLX5_NAJNA
CWEALLHHSDLHPACKIEVPERLSSCYGRLQHYNLIERCILVSAREGTESEIMLIHSMDYVGIVKSTEKMEKEELQRVSAEYDAVYFHQTTYRCAKLAVGATLQLVDAVLSGKAHNGLTLIRPPGHHSQRSAANGFCIFNNVAIAAKYAQRKYGLQRILIVDWDVHHGQGIQYAFEDDPSVLYFSWHRFEHQKFWPWLSESNYDAVGQGKGRGFTINVPWNQVGMGNSDYLAVFLHVLLPIAFEVTFEFWTFPHELHFILWPVLLLRESHDHYTAFPIEFACQRQAGIIANNDLHDPRMVQLLKTHAGC